MQRNVTTNTERTRLKAELPREGLKRSVLNLLSHHDVLAEVELVHAGKHAWLVLLVVALLGWFDLNRGVEDFELFLEELGDAIERVAWVSSRDDVGSENNFIVTEGPHMEVVNLFDEGQL